MLKRFVPLILAAMALALTVAACGDDDGDAAQPPAGEPSASGEQPASSSSQTKAQFLKEASDICIREREKLGKEATAFGQGFAKDDPRVEEAEYFPPLVREVVLPSIRRQLAQLRELEVPPGEEESVEEVFSLLEKTIAEAAANPASGSDPFRLQFNEHRRVATEYGLSNCVYP